MEFCREIATLGQNNRLKHRNLVSFIGFCDEKGEKIIVNKFEVNKSLDKHLNISTLTWMQRLQICVGVARALYHIHYHIGYDSSIIHGNIKSSKILLDDDWKPKLSGFKHSRTNTRARRHRLVLAEVVGTIGYVDPTYEKTGFVTHKSDVYSFGVLLFEVLCGKRAFVLDDQVESSPQFFELNYQKEEMQMKTTSIENLKSSVDDTFDRTFSPEQQSIVSSRGQAPPFLAAQQLDSIAAPLAYPFSTAERHSFSEQPSQLSPGQKPNSFSGPQPHSFSRQQPHSFSEQQPHSFSGRQPDSFSGQQPDSFSGGADLFGDPTQAEDEYVGISLVGKKFKKMFPDAYYKDEKPLSLSDDRLGWSSSSTTQLQPYGRPLSSTEYTGPRPDLLFDVQTSSPIDPVSILIGEQLERPPSSKVLREEQHFKLQPLFTMKRLEQYLHSPNEALLAQLARSRYEGGNLKDLINPALWEQIDPQSFKVFTQTAYNCLREHRPQRPNIDQILPNLEIALKHQMRRDFPEHSIVISEVEGRSSNRWKVTNLF